jgi:hypothetical protein
MESTKLVTHTELKTGRRFSLAHQKYPSSCSLELNRTDEIDFVDKLQEPGYNKRL